MLELSEHIFEMVVCATMMGFACLVYAQNDQVLRLRQRLNRERIAREALASDLGAVLACSRNIGAKVQMHEKQQAQMSKKLSGIDNVSAENAMSPVYERVYKLVEQGINLDEIAEICDLGRSEVELLTHIAECRAAA